jgi:hypothetical protein
MNLLSPQIIDTKDSGILKIAAEMCATFLVMPLVRTKTILQTLPRNPQGLSSNQNYRSISGILKEVTKVEGYKGLWKYGFFYVSGFQLHNLFVGNFR